MSAKGVISAGENRRGGAPFFGATLPDVGRAQGYRQLRKIGRHEGRREEHWRALHRAPTAARNSGNGADLPSRP
jgi:hypothetical protein